VYLCAVKQRWHPTHVHPKLWWWVCCRISLLAEVLSHFTIGNLNSHSCKVYFVGCNYNCMPNTILSNIYIFSCVDLHKNFPCQLYDLSNLSLFHVPHLDHSSVHQECRKFSMSLDMSLLILFISCFSCWTQWWPIARLSTECGPKLPINWIFWMVFLQCKVNDPPKNLAKYQHVTIPLTCLETQLCWTRKLCSVLR